MKYIIGAFIGAIMGFMVYYISKYVVDKESEKWHEYGLYRFSLIIAMVIFTIAIIFKFNLEESIKFWTLGVVLILLGIIDYYTHYVYLRIIGIGAAAVIITTIVCEGTWMNLHINSTLWIGLLLFICAYFRGLS